MPPELYLGAVAVVILIVLLASMFRRKGTPRRSAPKAVDTDQLVRQLSRIADALEKLVVQSQTLPALLEEPAPPPQQKVPERVAERVPDAAPEKVPQPAGAAPIVNKEEQSKKEEPAKPKEPHVSLSMFGR